ncbi:hypothetical protein DL96DRAFT_569966 [Flagelloscypha sp. PMI_526]|nr:hypothetical protein DL96DRAFT_569966 [Flagelloscypha sp. PMI_526]
MLVHRVDPLLFRNLTFELQGDPKRYLALHSTAQSPRLLRIRPYVRSIYFHHWISLEEFSGIVALHPDINFLSFEVVPPHGADDYDLPYVTHFSAAFVDWGSGISLSGAHFPSLTHLQLEMMDILQLPQIQADLAGMPSLEAVLIGATQSRNFQLERIQKALTALPSNVDLLVCWTDMHGTKIYWGASADSDAERFALGEIDSRVVMATTCSVTEVLAVPPHFVTGMTGKKLCVWEYDGCQEVSVWKRARVIQTRRIEDANRRLELT